MLLACAIMAVGFGGGLLLALVKLMASVGRFGRAVVGPAPPDAVAA